MRRRLIGLGGIVAFVVLAATPAAAITSGVPDTQHRNVGAMLLDFDFDGTGPEGPMRIPSCSGSLLAANLFLTAAHCIDVVETFQDQVEQVLVSFDADLRLDEEKGAVDPANVIVVTHLAAHPAFRCNLSTCYDDIGVLTLASSPSGISPIELPTIGFLDEQAAGGGLLGHVFVSVGYGLTSVDRSLLSPTVTATIDGLRRMSTSPFMALTENQLFLLENVSATGQGGTCAGDSGGPKFYEPIPGALANLVVAITTSGDPVCRSHSQNQRLDTASARSFLDDFVALP
jgi:hypothetical protein